MPVLALISFYGLAIIGGRKGQMFYFLGLLLHAGYVIYRGILLGRLPVAERHDILLVMALIVALSFFYFYRRVSLTMILESLSLFVVVLSVFAILQERMDSIEPAMSSPWFYVYVIFFIIGYAFFTISAVAGILYFRDKAAIFELIQYRIALYGWLLFSFSLIGGSFWFFLTYGSYWHWTAKELWITIVWFYYSFYLHSRLLRFFAGTPSVVIGIAGFPVILFSYLGVMPILGSPWTQF